MASSLSNAASLPVPEDIRLFFQTVYGEDPVVVQQKRDLLYKVQEREISIIIDPFRGCHIDVKPLSDISVNKMSRVQGAIEKLAESIRSNRSFNSIWIDLALPNSVMLFGVIAPASFVMGKPGFGDLVYDYQNKKVRVWQWLHPERECSIPAGATHNIGASALLIDKVAKKILLVVDNRRQDTWNLPQGSFDPAKDSHPSDTALREAQEEGGFTLSEKLTVPPTHVGDIDFPKYQFAPAINQIWAFFIDGISNQKLNPPPHEIKTAEWVAISEILESDEKMRGRMLSDEIKVPLLAALNGQGFQEVANRGFMVVHAPKRQN